MNTDLFSQISADRVVFISAPSIDRADVNLIIFTIATSLGVTYEPISILDAEESSFPSIFKMLKSKLENKNTLTVLYGIPSLLADLSGIQYQSIVQLLIEAYYDAPLKNSYVILADRMAIDLPEEVSGVISTYIFPLPSRSKLIDELDAFGWDGKLLAECVAGLSIAEVKLGLKLARANNLSTFSEQRKFLLNFKISRLKLSGLEIMPTAEIAEFGGMDLLRAAIERLIFRFSDEVLERGLKYPKGWLFVGPPGTGKTHAAKAIASQLGWATIMLGVDKVAKGGVTDFKQILAKAEANEPALLYIDELDKFFAGDSTDPQILGALLTWLQDRKGKIVVIATLNRIDYVPPELTRRGRFDALYYIGFPNYAERRDILRLYACKFDRRYSNDVDDFIARNDWARILYATNNFSGSELAAVIDIAWEEELVRNIEAVTIEPKTIIDAANTLVPLYVRDNNRIVDIQNRSRQIALPVSSGQDDYAPGVQDVHGRSAPKFT
jgi:MoxR-like ATPase